MNNPFPHIMMLLPAMFLLLMLCVVLLAGVFAKSRITHHRWSYYLTQFTLVGVFYLVLRQVGHGTMPIAIARHSLVFDHLSSVSILCILLGYLFVFIYAKKEFVRLNCPSAEYYALGLFALLGMMIMVSATNLVTMYLAIELMSLPFYGLCAYLRHSGPGTEAAIKYFVTGAIASGLLLYGISLVYGMTHSFDFTIISQVAQSTEQTQLIILLIGIVFIIAGFAFKFGIVPFHQWVPDVYQGAPTVVVLLLGTVPKIAVLALMIRLFYGSFDQLHAQWQQLLNLLAVLSIFVGNIAALVQTNIKRLLAYSSIGHMGYILLAVATGTVLGLSAALFYMLTYVLVTIAALGILVLLNNNHQQIENLTDLVGLNNQKPWLALMLLFAIFSMAGIPPTVGFIAKLGIIMTLVHSHQIAMAVYLVLMAVVGLYYYLRVIKTVYFEANPNAASNASIDTKNTNTNTVAITINGIVILFLGIFPAGLMSLCHFAFV